MSNANGHTPIPPGVCSDIAHERAYVYVKSLAQLNFHEHRFLERQQQPPGLLIPHRKLGADKIEFCSLRPDRARMTDDGKEVKYETPAGVPLCLDVLPRYREALGDPTIPIWITEGAKKADALGSHVPNIVPINIFGVWCWKRKGKDGASRPLEEFKAIPWKGRLVVLAFDKDVTVKIEVQQALKALAKYLASLGALVRVLILPSDGEKGVDDALAVGMTTDELQSYVCDLDELPPPAKQNPDLLDAGRRWAELYGRDWAYDQEAGNWRRWTRTHWEEETRTTTRLDMQAAIVLRALDMPVSSSGRLDGVTRMAATICNRTFQRRPGLVNFRNGTLDVTTMQLRPHDPADGLDYCLSYTYTPGPHPQIDAFLLSTIPDPDARAAYQAHIGLALISDTKLHKALLAKGPPRSGKSTLLALANSVCGNDAYAGAGPELFDRETEGLRSRSTWNGRRLVTIEELPVEALRNEELFKAMTAHSGVAQRRLHQPEATSNQWLPKIFMATNEAPRYSDRSGALTERLIIISCPNSRSEGQRDIHLLDKLLPELGTFAATCIRQAWATLAAGHYPQSDVMRRELAEIEQSGDAVKSFVIEECVIEPDAWTDTATLYAAYRTYCEENGHSAMSKNKFTQAVCERFRMLQAKGRHTPKAAGTALVSTWTRISLLRPALILSPSIGAMRLTSAIHCGLLWDVGPRAPPSRCATDIWMHSCSTVS